MMTWKTNEVQYRRLRVEHWPIPTGLNNQFIFRFSTLHTVYHFAGIC